MEEETYDSMQNYLILDTNIVLLDNLNIEALGADGTIIVLPDTVVNELDSKKSVPGELGYQSRAFGRLIAKGSIQSVERMAALVITPVVLNSGVKVHITSTNVYPDFTEVAGNILNDRKIIEVALQYSQAYSNVEFMSNDVMCRISAMSLGLRTTDLKEVEQSSFNFIKTCEVADDLFGLLHNKPINAIDPDYKPEYFNYRFTNATLGYTKLATIDRGIISIIGKTTEKELRRQDVEPANSEQLLLSQAIQQNTSDVIVCEAKAGSGKTLVALSNAMKLIKQNNPYEGIIYVRASIDDAEDVEQVGFLPGLEEKFAVYFHPVKDSIEFIVRNRSKGSKLKGEEYELFVEAECIKLMSQYNISMMTGLGMRGRTFTDSIIIIDEVQGQSKASVQKMLTRVGKNCKVIIIGSNNQIDNPYVTKFNNGLSVLLNECTKEQPNINLYAVNLNKIIRSPLAEWAEGVFSKDKS